MNWTQLIKWTSHGRLGNFGPLSPVGSVLVANTHEISFEWIYIPPFFFTVLMGFVCAFVITRVLNKTGLSRWFWHTGLAFVAFWVLTTSLIGLFLISP